MATETKTTKSKAKSTPKKAAAKKPAAKKVATTKKTEVKKAPAKKVVAKKTPAKASPKAASNVFAVVNVNGKQLKVEVGQKFELNKLDGLKGDKLEITDVLLYSDGKDVKVGAPYVKGAKVTATIDSQKKDKKMRVFKYKAKAGYRRTYGSRAQITRLLIESIIVSS